MVGPAASAKLTGRLPRSVTFADLQEDRRRPRLRASQWAVSVASSRTNIAPRNTEGDQNHDRYGGLSTLAGELVEGRRVSAGVFVDVAGRDISSDVAKGARIVIDPWRRVSAGGLLVSAACLGQTCRRRALRRSAQGRLLFRRP
jgi:hypothetical protein